MMLHQLLHYMMHIVQHPLKNSFQADKKYKSLWYSYHVYMRIFHHNENYLNIHYILLSSSL